MFHGTPCVLHAPAYIKALEDVYLIVWPATKCGRNAMTSVAVVSSAPAPGLMRLPPGVLAAPVLALTTPTLASCAIRCSRRALLAAIRSLLRSFDVMVAAYLLFATYSWGLVLQGIWLDGFPVTCSFLEGFGYIKPICVHFFLLLK